MVREPLWGNEREAIAPLFPELDAVQASPNILTSVVEHNDLKAAFGGSYFLAQKPKWLGEEPATPDELNALLVPCPDDVLKLWPVDRQKIGNVRNKSPEVAEPVEGI